MKQDSTRHYPRPWLRKWQHKPLLLVPRALPHDPTQFLPSIPQHKPTSARLASQSLDFMTLIPTLHTCSRYTFPQNVPSPSVPLPNQSLCALDTELKSYLFCGAFLWQLKPLEASSASPTASLVSFHCHFHLALCHPTKTVISPTAAHASSHSMLRYWSHGV